MKPRAVKQCKTNLDLPTPEHLFGVQLISSLIRRCCTERVCTGRDRFTLEIPSVLLCSCAFILLRRDMKTHQHFLCLFKNLTSFPRGLFILGERKRNQSLVLKYDCRKPAVMPFCSWLERQWNVTILNSFLLLLHVGLFLCDIFITIGWGFDMNHS